MSTSAVAVTTTNQVPELLDFADMLFFYRIPKSTAYDIINRDGLPSVKIGRKRMFRRADVEAYIAERTK